MSDASGETGQVVHLHAGSGRFSSYFMDKFVAPNISAFDQADIPDMSGFDSQSEHWLANFVLNSAFNGSYTQPMQTYAFNFYRRVMAAFSEHHTARKATLQFLASEKQSASSYAVALLHWEFFLGQSWHAYVLFERFLQSASDKDVPRPFTRGDGTVVERLNDVYNSMKHVEGQSETGQILEDATVPVWLSNDGLNTITATLGYDDTAQILRDLAGGANVIVDARKLVERNPPST